MQTLIPYIAVAFIYLSVAADFWRTAKVSDHKSTAGNTANAQSQNLHSAMIALGLLLHGWLLFNGLFGNGFNLGFYNALSAIFWLTVLIYWLSDLKHELHSLQAFVLPPAAIFAVLPAFTTQNHYLPVTEVNMFLVHIGIAILAYSLFTFAALHALLMTIAERSLHNRPTLIKLPSFPPLMVMETLLFRIISLGFILLTITLISGMLFSEQIFAKPMQLNHKTIFSIASWLIYGALLFGRYKYGWRGQIAIRWTLAGFALLLLAYIGSKFVLEVLLHR
ncbi:MAG TPA: cytochrome c biogenesis protein CcsA [Methylotenera sp.]|nr:cytochrome c biogenesis protein CcsA [Methylotenera sp.]